MCGERAQVALVVLAAAAAALWSHAGANNCAALAGSCVCIGEDVAQCVDTNASDLSFLRGLRNRSRFSEVIVYHNSIPVLRNGTFQALQLSNLRTVRLAYNGIATVEARAFQGLRRLRKLVLVRNNIRALPTATFDGAAKLALLDLSNNQLADLQAVRQVDQLEDLRLANNSLSQLGPRALCAARSCRLRSLTLANNHIHRVDSWAFDGLHCLESLNLSENEIASLHYLTFVNATHLKELDLRRNRISEVDFVCAIQSLKYLVLAENHIRHVANDTFVCGHQSSLIHIDLSGNQIVTMEPAAFHGLYSVWDLLLSRNRISSIHPATFLNCTNLRSLDLRYNYISDLHFVRDIIMLWNLDLSFNQIATLPSGTFAHHNLTQLLDSGANSNGTCIKFVLSRTITNINLAHNRLTALESGALKGLFKLYHLDLSWNNISYLSPNVFQLHSQMARLNVEGNRLTTLDALFSAPGLTTCDASNNALSHLPSSFAYDTSRVRQLQLSGNSIPHLHPSVFESFSQLLLLNLTDNTLNTTSFVSRAVMLEYVYLAHNRISHLPQNAFSSTTTTSALKSIDVSHNRITSVHEAALQGLHSLIYLNISHNSITSFPQGVFRGAPLLRELDASNNRLTRVDWVRALGADLHVLRLCNNSIASLGQPFGPAASALAALDLSGNALSALGEGALGDLPQLRTLDLSRNRLTRVAAGALRNATRLRYLGLAHNRLQSTDFLRDPWALDLEEIDLSHNQVSALAEPLVGPASGGAARLSRLDLSHNSLSALGAGALRNLVSLHALELRGNALAQLDGAALAHCGALLQLGLGANRLTRLAQVPHAPRLKHLYVFANRIRRLANDSFAESRLSQVVHLNASACGVEAVEAGALRPLRMLRYLDLSRNAISSLPEALFADNALLSALDVSGNRLVGVAPALLRPCAALEFLDLSRNALAAPPSAADAPLLRYLDLSANALRALPRNAFAGMRKLEVLDLSGNEVEASAPALATLPDGCAVGLGEGNAPLPRKRLFNLYDISSSELEKFAKLYMWILIQSNNNNNNNNNAT